MVKSTREPWKPTRVVGNDRKLIVPGEITEFECHSIKACMDGVADSRQQKVAMNAIIVNVCRADDMSYRSDDMGGDRDTAFAEGMRHVGLQLRKFLILTLEG